MPFGCDGGLGGGGACGGGGIRQKMTESLRKWRGSGWHNQLYLSLMRQCCLAGFYWSSSSHRLEPSVQPVSLLVDRILAPVHRLPGWREGTLCHKGSRDSSRRQKTDRKQLLLYVCIQVFIYVHIFAFILYMYVYLLYLSISLYIYVCTYVAHFIIYACRIKRMYVYIMYTHSFPHTHIRAYYKLIEDKSNFLLLWSILTCPVHPSPLLRAVLTSAE